MLAAWEAFWLWTGLYAPLPQLEAFLPPRIQTAGAASTNFAASEWTLNDYAAALNQARMINLMDDMRMDGDRQPVESFLDRTITEVGHPKR